MTQQKKRSGSAPKKGARRGSKAAAWRGNREGLSKPAILTMVLLGVVAALLAWFLQGGDLLNGTPEIFSPLRLNEVMSENTSTLITETGDVPDWIEVINSGNAPVNVGKTMLLLESNINKAFSFPDRVLQPGETLLVYADGGRGDWNAPFKLPASGGDTIVLLSAQGKVIDSLSLPELDADVSFARNADGVWAACTAPTPGSANDGAGVVATGVQTHADALEITEVMTSNSLYFPDETGAAQDYVEIHNRTDGDVNLSGWYLSDSSDKLKRWSFPAIILPGNGYITVHCSGLNRTSDPFHLHTDFKLGSDGESVYLSRPDGQTVSMVNLPPLEKNQACSLVDGAWVTNLAPTPGMENTAEAAAQVNYNTFNSRNGGLVISEIMASAVDQEYDWIELYNGTGQSVSLEGFGLSDNAKRPRKWQFPAGSSIAPGQYMLVCLSGKEDAAIGGYVNANFSLSSQGGYSVSLSDPAGNVLDACYLPPQYGGVSYGRIQGQAGHFYMTQATPEAANGGAYYRSRAAEPVCSVEGGLFTSGQSFNVELSAPVGSRIYYTLDSSDPDETSTLYTGPIPVSSTTILRSRVYRDGCMPSLMDTQSYLFDVQNASNVHVISLVSDMKNLSSPETGIMVAGNNNNHLQEWEREAHVEIFSADGTKLISQGCGISLHGQDSRKLPIKSFNVIARSKYGDSRFRYPLFSERDYTEYQSILLRASGEDYNMSFMRDTLLSSLMAETSVMYQKYEIGIVYLDGQYYTLCYIRERINPVSICQFEGWEGMEKDIDLVKGNSSVAQGSNSSFEALLKWVKNNDLTTDAAYDYIGSQIDIRNYIEYMTLQLFSGNTDTLNVRRYRNPNTDGKWRWALFDLDWAFFNDTDSIGKWLTPGGAGAGRRTDNTLFIACMKNPRFRDEFLTHFGERMATDFTTANIQRMIQERYARIEGVLPQYLDQWDISLTSGIKKIMNYAAERPTKLLGYFKNALNFSNEEMQKYFGDAIAVIQASGEVNS